MMHFMSTRDSPGRNGIRQAEGILYLPEFYAHQPESTNLPAEQASKLKRSSETVKEPDKSEESEIYYYGIE